MYNSIDLEWAEENEDERREGGMICFRSKRVIEIRGVNIGKATQRAHAVLVIEYNRIAERTGTVQSQPTGSRNSVRRTRELDGQVWCWASLRFSADIFLEKELRNGELGHLEMRARRRPSRARSGDIESATGKIHIIFKILLVPESFSSFLSNIPMAMMEME
nr:hypothetical protein Iba_chr06bCG15350 [Ipomoea batatas]